MTSRGRVLVTGGAGYIGSHTCKALAAQGFEPVTYDDLSRGHRDSVRWGPLEVGDVGNFRRLTEVIRKYQPVAALHFAAFAYVGESMSFPQMYYLNNVGGSLSLMSALLQEGVRTFIFSSSCATYGIPEENPISESCQQHPANPYGWTKLVVEQALKDYAQADGLRYGILRYFNAAGADSDGELGECHEPETHAVPLAIRAALDCEKFSVFGTDYDTPDGTAIRDYIHVEDLAWAHVLGLNRLLDNGESFAVNLGTGRGYSVAELVECVERTVRKSVPRRHAPRRAGDPPMLVADPRLAKEILGWVATRSSLEEIVQSAVRWHTRSRRLREA